MLFNSAQFLCFFPISIAIFYIVPQKYRYLWLLVASYYFYMQWNPAYIFLLLSSTLITYVGGLVLEKTVTERKRKICLFICLVINLAVLGYFKYANLFMGYLNKAIVIAGHEEIPWDNAIILPVGISFFTLQALGYLIDVYRKDIYAEHNFFRYALFISFFPQLVAGPIERSKNLLKQLAVPYRFSYENLRRGLMIMLYGFFLKVVIADRTAIFVDAVYNNANAYPGFYILVATVLFAIQIYCDFYGYSTIAKGTALTMGIKLMDNFNAPYFSKSIKEFWRRWHISLSTWFRDYLYIPLGGNRKGIVRKYANLMIVFAVSGLWHGASLSFVIWGVLHGLYQVLGGLFRSFYKKVSCRCAFLNKSDERFSTKLFQWALTIILICFAWLFFRANSISSARLILKQMLAERNWIILFNQSLYELGVSRDYFNILLMALAVLFFVDYQKYRGRDVLAIFFQQGWWLRCLVEVILLMTIILFGCYGSAYDVQQFIYFQF